VSKTLFGENRQMPEEPIVIRPSEGYGVLVPCSPDDFVDFISKLLGKPQVAEGRSSGHFNIDLDDIKNFYHLIEQRMIEQNRGRLVQFTANIHYDDGTSVEVETLPRLEQYAEVRPLVSTGVMLTWIYLVTFNIQTVPEKQQIEVTFDTSRRVRSQYRWEPPIDVIKYRVAYTARTWGADIENL
jgi:hypothetical protein